LHDVLTSEDGSEGAHDSHERQWLEKYDAVIACSEEDARLAPHGNVFTVPNGAALDCRYKQSPPRAPILFLGPFRYPPNFQGIQEFLRLSYARLRRNVPTAELWIFGGLDAPRIASEFECFDQDGVRVMDYTEHPREWLDRCALTINPLRDVRGSCVKVIESLAAGRVCVSTEDGARGYLHRGFDGLIVTGTVAEFVEPLERLLLDDEYRRSLESPSLEALRPFSWKYAGEVQAGIYRQWMTRP
jgi:glycosyltransferase involved in cell wall biosynthesis